MEKDNKLYFDMIEKIQSEVKQYIIDNKLQSLVIGVSGGFDSGFGCAILSPICKELNIPLIGRYISIESNTQEERDRADMIGNAFCTDYKAKDLTVPYHFMTTYFDESNLFGGYVQKPTDSVSKIRRGNIKVRMRIAYLYNIAHKTKGIIVGCNNQTEYLLGFFTLGDGGDINPFIDLFKTELYDMAKAYIERLETDEEKQALQAVIDAVPTDGLGITSSDVEQFGAKNYDDVDKILMNYAMYHDTAFWDESLYNELCSAYTKETVDKILNRHKNSEFKRNHPYKIKFS